VAGNSLTHVSVPIKAWRLLPVEKIKEEEWQLIAQECSRSKTNLIFRKTNRLVEI
jgi:hypothetical protein